MSSISSSSGLSSFIDSYTFYDSTDSQISNRSLLSSTTPSSEVAWTTSSLPSMTSDFPVSPSLTSISSETYEFLDSSIGSERPHLPDFWEMLASSIGSSTDSFISSDHCKVLDNSGVPSPLSDPLLDNFSSSHMPTLPSTPISAQSPLFFSSTGSSITSPLPSNTSSDVSNPSLSSSSSLKSRRNPITQCTPSQFFNVVNVTSALMIIETDRLRLTNDPCHFQSHINHHGYRDFYLSDAPNRQLIVLFKTRSLAEKISKQRSDLHPYLSPFGSVNEDFKKELFVYCKACKKVQLAYGGLAFKKKDGCCSWKKVNARIKKEKVDIQAKLIFSTSPAAINHPASALLPPSMTASSTTTPSSSIISPSTTLSSTTSSSKASSTSPTLPPTTDVGNSAAGPSNAFILAAVYMAAPCALEGLQATTPTAIPNRSLININTPNSTTSSSSSSSVVASATSSRKRSISSDLPDKKARLNSGKMILKSQHPS